MRRLAALIALTLLAACGGVPEAEPFQGVWVSRGWGIVLHVSGGDADVYEVGGSGCLLTSAGSARNIDEVAALESGTLVLRDGGRSIVFDPGLLPDGCVTPGEAQPAAVLAAVVTAFEDHYHPGLDHGWADRVAALGDPADDAALEAAIQSLLAPLGDPAVALRAREAGVWSPPEPEGVAALRASLLAGGPFPGAVRAAADGIVTADLGGGIGYLGLLRLGGFADSSSGSQRVLAAALDLTLRDYSAVVLDLRTTTVGSEEEALLVATRFYSAVTVVASLSALVPGDGMVPAGEAVVNPLPTGPYPGRVIVLVGPGTAGPAELLALALAELPGITIVGEDTAGSPRSPLVRTLPNGWVLGVPNTDVTTPDGSARVGRPLVPDIVAAYSAADAAAGDDPGIEAALGLLGG